MQYMRCAHPASLVASLLVQAPSAVGGKFVSRAMRLRWGSLVAVRASRDGYLQGHKAVVVMWPLHRAVDGLKLVHDLTVRVDMSKKWKARCCDVFASPKGMALPAFKERDVLVEFGQRKVQNARLGGSDLLALADAIMKGIKLKAQTNLAELSDAYVASFMQVS